MSVASYFVKEMCGGGITSAISKTLKKAVKRMLGIDRLEDENKTLYYFLNAFHNVKDTPIASGSLRELQDCDVILLKIFDLVCKKNRIPYWLDYGTLLGAYRHKGFIPWDDDMDVAMLRENYDNAIPILRDSFSRLGVGFEASEKEGAPMVRIGIGYKHSRTGVWLDVFPVDLLETSETIDNIRKPLTRKMLKYRKYYYRHRNKINRNRIVEKKNKIISFPVGTNKILYHGPEYIDYSLYIHKYDDVFPLKKIVFENNAFPAPNSSEIYLSELYGINYMQFPHNGVEHHGGELKLAQWSERSHTDMHEVYKELKEVYDKLSDDSDTVDS